MDLSLILKLLGGLALFLYGMQMMSDGLEKAAGDRLKTILEKLTSNRFLGVIVGALITAAIQSSSATTVMVIGFVNARLMTLQQAVWIIMGANIGTTITGQLVALNVSEIAPLIAFAGVVLIVFLKNPKLHYFGSIIAGLGILFIGMDMMSSSMSPLRESEAFISLLTNFSNPAIGILVGALFTALIQSSSASLGILQALARSGLIGLDGAVFVLFGQNIGTCITAILASFGTSREAKQTTIIHLSFNIIGTIIFTTVCLLTPLTSVVAGWSPDNAAQQIANMHTLFNVVTTLILLPFGTYLAALAQHILPSEKLSVDSEGLMYLQPLPKSNKIIGLSAINVQQVNDEIMRMMKLAYTNVSDAFDQLINYKEDRSKSIQKREAAVNFLNSAISKYITDAFAYGNLNQETSKTLTAYYTMLVDIERISDYAINMDRQALVISKETTNDAEKTILRKMKKRTFKMHDFIFDLNKANNYNNQIDENTQEWRTAQIQGLKDKTISSELGIAFSRILTDYDRINDHAVNLAEEIDKIDKGLLETMIEEHISVPEGAVS
ncbi:Na/Pi cotransporter family protein [Faecalicoccus pleomorphus]|uniref:Na/Pi cotransporter family protein n=2 Tax=Faecalicoccus TaxID=1573536 RepID=A0A3E3E3P6_9FIRM|nr:MULTISPECIES: Na/Pi cotransporter family protein [Faecalicoccus]MDB7979194.1 Na/Pi cotransporter family protein [Faecalicoccus pleomorphus]MDB7981674.1 Na/Pi cotransporter family protein [Faecalicoccus pleomorphus]MDY4278197.1 Na/Pi cotransporter family protein [Faecalicoccus sp.]MDY5110982.1 Na/Pi cotransporter family protein [Faecalicoccus sp.]RGD76180.1 Na/Pi cotransporter family protein [Faecalicoccus pleomorphus]